MEYNNLVFALEYAQKFCLSKFKIPLKEDLDHYTINIGLMSGAGHVYKFDLLTFKYSFLQKEEQFDTNFLLIIEGNLPREELDKRLYPARFLIESKDVGWIEFENYRTTEEDEKKNNLLT